MTIHTAGLAKGVYIIVMIVDNRKVGVKSVVKINSRSD
jgi:hypothetical protein